MNLIIQVGLMTVLICTVCAVPRIGVESSLLRFIEAQAGALADGNSACYSVYDNATSSLNETLRIDTNKCEAAANRTTVTNEQNSNATVAIVRSQHLILEQNLQQCRNQTDNESYLICSVGNFDKNLELLDSSNTLSHEILSLIASNNTIVSAQRSSCISVAVSNFKVNATKELNTLNECLSMARNHRESQQYEQVDYVQPVEEVESMEEHKVNESEASQVFDKLTM